MDYFDADGNKVAYSQLYVADIIDIQGKMFYEMRDYLPGVDEKWFIETFMKSDIRRCLDNGNFLWANKFPLEIIDKFIQSLGGDYKRGETWGGFLPEWVGWIYAEYQWRYNVPSAELIEILPLSEMERIFPTLHQCGESAACQKIHDEVLKYHYNCNG